MAEAVACVVEKIICYVTCRGEEKYMQNFGAEV
jgi:hypothetical protein